MSPEEATKVADMRSRILRNVQQGLPPEHGLSAAELQEILNLTRQDQRAAQMKSKASGVSSPAAAATDITALQALFKKPAAAPPPAPTAPTEPPKP